MSSKNFLQCFCYIHRFIFLSQQTVLAFRKTNKTFLFIFLYRQTQTQLVCLYQISGQKQTGPKPRVYPFITQASVLSESNDGCDGAEPASVFVSRIVRPRDQFGTRSMEHAVRTWSMVCQLCTASTIRERSKTPLVDAQSENLSPTIYTFHCFSRKLCLIIDDWRLLSIDNRRYISDYIHKCYIRT